MQSKYNGEIIRIQSSHLESHAFDKLFYGLSDSLLYHIANRHSCIIVDCTSNSVAKVKKIGVPIIKAVLAARWFDIRETYLGKEYLLRILKSLSPQSKSKIKYYKKFNPSYPINLEAISLHVDKEIQIIK